MTKHDIMLQVNLMKVIRPCVSIESKADTLLPIIGYRAILDAFEFSVNESIDQQAQIMIAKHILLNLFRK